MYKMCDTIFVTKQATYIILFYKLRVRSNKKMEKITPLQREQQQLTQPSAAIATLTDTQPNEHPLP